MKEQKLTVKKIVMIAWKNLKNDVQKDNYLYHHLLKQTVETVLKIWYPKNTNL